MKVYIPFERKLYTKSKREREIEGESYLDSGRPNSLGAWVEKKKRGNNLKGVCEKKTKTTHTLLSSEFHRRLELRKKKKDPRISHRHVVIYIRFCLRFKKFIVKGG